jgi:hypothetical protein
MQPADLDRSELTMLPSIRADLLVFYHQSTFMLRDCIWSPERQKEPLIAGMPFHLCEATETVPLCVQDQNQSVRPTITTRMSKIATQRHTPM